MLSGLLPSAQRFLLDIGRQQARSQRAQRQLTSGLKVSQASDAPDQISRLLTARAGLQRTTQVNANLGRVKTEVDTAEQTLQSAVQLMDRARVLGAQGISGNQSASTRGLVAIEIQSILDRLVSSANVAVEGRYLFSGDADQVVPYSLDPLVPSGVSAYQGSAATRKIADAHGLTFSVAATASEIFDSSTPDQNVFAAVNGMRRALLAADNPPIPPDPTIPSLNEAMHNLAQSALYLNEKLAGYGLTQNRVAESAAVASGLELSLRRQIAQIEESDLAEAATELTQSTLGLNAAYQTRATTPRRSLFDYLG